MKDSLINACVIAVVALSLVLVALVASSAISATIAKQDAMIAAHKIEYPTILDSLE